MPGWQHHPLGQVQLALAVKTPSAPRSLWERATLLDFKSVPCGAAQFKHSISNAEFIRNFNAVNATEGKLFHGLQLGLLMGTDSSPLAAPPDFEAVNQPDST